MIHTTIYPWEDTFRGIHLYEGPYCKIVIPHEAVRCPAFAEEVLLRHEYRWGRGFTVGVYHADGDMNRVVGLINLFLLAKRLLLFIDERVACVDRRPITPLEMRLTGGYFD